MSKDVSPRTRCSRCSTTLCGLIVLLAAGVVVYNYGQQNGFNFFSSSPGVRGGAPMIALETVALHSNDQDCWMAMHGGVYDLTEYGDTHPGGARIIWRYCGQDATAAYSDFHSERLLRTVSQFHVGNLGDENAVVQDPPLTSTSPATTSNGSCLAKNSLQSHNNPNDCWQIINDIVYDFTDYMNRHPGGPETIIPHCGTDATAAFFAEAGHNQRLLDRLVARYAVGSACGLNGATAVESKPATPVDNVCFSINEVFNHDRPNDCWQILYGRVYDFTDYARRHPGGADEIVEECGNDATEEFAEEDGHNLQMLNDLAEGYRLGDVC